MATRKIGWLKNLVALWLAGCLGAAVAGSIPTDEEIQRIFATPGTNHECYTNLLPYLCSMRDLAIAGRCSNELCHAQYLILTNVVNRPFAPNGDYHLNFTPKVLMLDWVDSFSSLQGDIEATEYLADYIGQLQPLSTEAYTNELREAMLALDKRRREHPEQFPRRASFSRYCSNEVWDCERRWRPVVLYNSRLRGFRCSAIENYHPLYMSCLNVLPESEHAAFRTNIIRRAELSEDEIPYLLSTEFDWGIEGQAPMVE